MSVFLAVLVWLVAITSPMGANGACAAFASVKEPEKWIGYPYGWEGYDDGQGSWVFLPIIDGGGVLIIDQEYDRELWVFVMRSENNHDFCGPFKLPAP